MAATDVTSAAARAHCPRSEAVVIDIRGDLGRRGVADGQVACLERSFAIAVSGSASGTSARACCAEIRGSSDLRHTAANRTAGRCECVPAVGMGRRQSLGPDIAIRRGRALVGQVQCARGSRRRVVATTLGVGRGPCPRPARAWRRAPARCSLSPARVDEGVVEAVDDERRHLECPKGVGPRTVEDHRGQLPRHAGRVVGAVIAGCG